MRKEYDFTEAKKNPYAPRPKTEPPFGLPEAHAGAVTQRIRISFDAWYRALSTLLGLPPSGAYVELGLEDVEVRMGWAFRARFPRAAVKSVEMCDTHPWSRGVHGFGGDWLVNGSSQGLLSVQLEPAQQAYVMGFPVRLRELEVSVEEPDTLMAALRPAA